MDGEFASGTSLINPAEIMRAVLSAEMLSLLAGLLRSKGGFHCIVRHWIREICCMKPMPLHIVPIMFCAKAPYLSLILRVKVFNRLRVEILHLLSGCSITISMAKTKNGKCLVVTPVV